MIDTTALVAFYIAMMYSYCGINKSPFFRQNLVSCMYFIPGMFSFISARESGVDIYGHVAHHNQGGWLARRTPSADRRDT